MGVTIPLRVTSRRVPSGNYPYSGRARRSAGNFPHSINLFPMVQQANILDTPFLTFSDETGSTEITLRSALESFIIFGGTGSGKTSGSSSLLSSKLLRGGFGGLVLSAKADERQLWERYAKQTGRTKDLIIVEPGGEHSFDFLRYISDKSKNKASYAENIVQTLTTIIRSSEEKSGGKSDDVFWENAQNTLIHNVIDLCLLSYNSVSVKALYDIVMSAPKADDTGYGDIKRSAFAQAFDKAQDNLDRQVETFKASLSKEEDQQLDTKEKFEAAILEAIPDAVTLKFLDQFFMDSYRTLSEKTRSIVEFSFTGFLFRLLKEPIYSLFCNKANTFSPESVLDGKIILLDLPVKLYHKVGRDIQVLFKYLFQQAMEKRTINDNTKPVFIYADEAQHFLHEYDADFLATSRSSRIISCYITQNLPNLHACMGGIKSEHRVKSLLGNMATKIFHANTDVETNRYASELIGDGYREDFSNTTTLGGEFSSSESSSYKLDRMVRPEEFQLLWTGGPKNNFLTSAYIHRQGQLFHDGLPFRKVIFQQNIK